MRPLAPQTERLYASALHRAFGSLPPGNVIPDHVHAWPESSRAILRAALRREALKAGQDPAWIERAIPRGYSVKRALPVPAEEEAGRYEAAAAELPPGVRVLALLPILLGLRASEVCGLTRASVERAAETGELVVLRKGGSEATIGVSRLRALFRELLDTPARAGPVRLQADPRPRGLSYMGTPPGRDPGGPSPRPEGPGRRPGALMARPGGGGSGEVAPRGVIPRTGVQYSGGSGATPGPRWEIAGQILSTGAGRAPYNRLRDLISEVGRAAGLKALRPHLLRHAFASRMNRDGAPIFTVQAALGHKNVATTQRYVHASMTDVEKYQRPVNPALGALLRPGGGTAGVG